MTSKEATVLEEIKNYYKENSNMPSIRFLQKKLNYKSSNSISQFLNSLEKEHYLIRNAQNDLVLSNPTYDNNLKTIHIVNTNKFIQIFLLKDKKYVGFLLKHNYFKDDNILKNDLLIIEVNKKVQENDFGLFIINNKYRIMKYNYLDGFHILTDKEQLILSKVKLIGKVIKLERNIH